jgi:serine/threonine-protein kinase RsbW
MKRIFSARLEDLHLILEWVMQSLSPMQLSSKSAMKLELALEEAIVNIIKHAYQNRSGPLEIVLQFKPQHSVEITLIDQGPPFDPLEKQPPDLSSNLEERAVGGLGIFFIRQSVDAIYYERKDGSNRLTFAIRPSQKE